MKDVMPCTNCEANEVVAELDATEALCEPCSNGVPLVAYDPTNWHRIGHEQCNHPWYDRPIPYNERGQDLQYKLERQWLYSLPADEIVSCLNGLPTIAEERIFTVEHILSEWFGINYGTQLKPRKIPRAYTVASAKERKRLLGK